MLPKSKKPQLNFPQTPRLPLHQMWSVTLAQGEVRGKVVGKMRRLLDGLEDRSVDVLLVALASVCSRFLLYFTTKLIPVPP